MFRPSETHKKTQELPGNFGEVIKALNKITDKINKIGLNNATNVNKKIDQGSFSKIYKNTIFGVSIKREVKNSTQDTNQSNELAVAKIKNNNRLNQQTHDSTKLLKEKGVASPFLQLYLYHNVKDGIKISEYFTERSLFDYLDKLDNSNSDFTVNNAKRIFGQIALGISCLHSQNVVHRDIKLENILVTTIDNTLLASVGDLDDIVEVDNSGRPINSSCLFAGSKDQAPPEFLNLYNTNKKKRHKNFDLKAVDCYCLGELLLDLYNFLDQDNMPTQNQKQFNDLINNLKKETPSERLTIEAVKKHSLFDIEGSSENLLDMISKEYADGVFVGSYYLKNLPEEDDLFFLLPETIKNITLGVGHIINKMNFLNNRVDSDADISIEHQSLQRNIQQVLNEIDDALEDYYPIEYKLVLKELSSLLANCGIKNYDNNKVMRFI